MEFAELSMRGQVADLEHRFSEKAKDRLKRLRLDLTPERLRWGIILEMKGLTEVVVDALVTLYEHDPEESIRRLRKTAQKRRGCSR
jgi:hypothetical protein